MAHPSSSVASAAELLAAPFATVSDLVRAHARERPAHIALLQDDAAGLRSIDYGTLDARMDAIAARLQREGLVPGGTVALCASNSVEYAVVFLAILRAGGVAVPLSTSATPESLERMRADAGSAYLLRERDLADWMATPRASPMPVRIEPDAPFNIIYSSGTTGEPKGIVQPHRMRWMHIQRGAKLGYDAAAVTLLSTPLYSNTTLVSFFPTIAVGGTAVLMAKFDVEHFLALAQRHRVSHAMLVPVQYQRFMAFPRFDAYDLSAFRLKTATSAPFAAALKAEVVRRWPGRLVDTYGLTEGGGTCLLDCTAHPDKLHTVGRPAEGHDIRLLDDDGHEVPPGQPGEVVGHSAGMMLGYHGRSDLTTAIEWRDATGKRFLRTGDVGRFDGAGFLSLVDRKKDLVISGGFNIYPSDLEAVLRQHPDVVDASVVGVPSAEWGETPVAFVVVRSVAVPDAIREWANARLGKSQRISSVEPIDALPRSPIGKVLKRELRDRWIAEQPTRG